MLDFQLVSNFYVIFNYFFHSTIYSLKFLHNYSGYRICFRLLVSSYSKILDPLKTSYMNLWKSSEFQVYYVFWAYCTTIKLSWTNWKSRGTTFLSIHHILVCIFSKRCIAIWLIGPGCCYTHNVVICVATKFIYEKAGIAEGSIFILFQACMKLSTYMTEFNTCVRRIVELDTLFFQITNWFMHKPCKSLC